MPGQTRVEELSRFRDKFDVPAVFGGVIGESGELDFDAIGIRRRGYPEPVAANDSVHIGSCCKMLTAVLFGTFVAEQRASWDMPIIELFPDLAESIAVQWQERTVEELFHCLSGMAANPPRRVLISGHADVRPLPQQRTEMAVFAFSEPPRKPGRFVYSNLSYIVLGAAIDRLSGSSFESALKARVLEPLNITSAGYGPPPEVWGHAPRVSLAGLGLFKGMPADPSESRSDNPPVMSSAGTLHLSCPDWAKLLRIFQAGSNLGVIDDDIVARILKAPRGKAAPMCMGWGLIGSNGLSYGAQGSNVRWSATALMDEARRRIALVVCNDGRSRVLSQSAALASRLLEL